MTPLAQKVWREGFAPEMSDEDLVFIREALAGDDWRLIQGATTRPPPLMCVADWPVEAGCLVSCCGIRQHGGYGVAKVGQVEERFAELCYKADQRLGEPSACRWFLNWFDDTPRDEMVRELLVEVDLALAGRAAHVESGA